MRKHINQIMILLTVCSALFAGHLIVSASRRSTTGEVSQSVRATRKLDGFDLAIQDVNRPSVTAEQSNCVAVAFSRIEEAYRKGCLRELQKAISDMPLTVTNLNSWAYLDISRRLSGLVWDDFLASRETRQFSRPEDLLEYLSVGKCAVRFLGETSLKRLEYPESLVSYDLGTLKTLKRYETQSRTKGWVTISEKIQSEIRDWGKSIDSESGFTYQYMRRQVALQYPHVDDGSWTVGKLFLVVRHNANGLIKAGYTPKWLDEFKDSSGGKDPLE